MVTNFSLKASHSTARLYASDPISDGRLGKVDLLLKETGRIDFEDSTQTKPVCSLRGVHNRER